MKARHSRVFLFTLPFLIALAGCGDKFWDPTQVGRFRPVPAVNVILDSLGVAEETPSAWEEAEQPRPVDVMVLETDYILTPGDVVRISIFELLNEGEEFTNDYVVTETGKISIPEVGIIEAAGLTESQLEEEIKQILSPAVLKKPSVNAILMSSQRRTFSILGDGVPTPGRYTIPRYDFRLNEALAIAGGIRQFNVSFVYVARSVSGKEVISEPVEHITEPQKPLSPQQEMLEVIKPHAKRPWPTGKFVIAATELAGKNEQPEKEKLGDIALPEGFENVVDSNANWMEQADEILALQENRRP